MTTQHSSCRTTKGLFVLMIVASFVAYSEQQFEDNANGFFGGGNPFGNSQQQFQQQQQRPNGQLIFSSGGGRPAGSAGPVFGTTRPPPPPPQSSTNQNQIGQTVFINNRPTVATLAPFISMPTQGPQFLNCVNTCPTTPEYNPVCGSDRQVYLNEQKFNCAVRCGADIQIVRRTSCEGLVQMQRG